MKKLIILMTLFSSYSLLAAEDCSFNFKDFHSLLESNSKKIKNVKPEVKDEISKTVTQEARLKTGEKVQFIGGGCAHIGYSFIYSNFKLKKPKIQDIFKKAHDLLVYTDIKVGYKEALVEALQKSLNAPIKKSKSDVYDLQCGEAICNLDLSKKDSMKINYSFAL